VVVFVQETIELLPLIEAFPDFKFVPVKSQTQYAEECSESKYDIGIIQTEPHFLDEVFDSRFRILLIGKNQLTADFFNKMTFSFIGDVNNDLDHVVNFIKNTLNKSRSRSVVKDLSMNELEINHLETEYAQYNQSLIQFRNEEKFRKNNEKKLNHILDFLNLNSGQNNFIDSLCELIWKEIKKNSAFLTLSFYLELPNNETLFVYFNRDFAQFYKNKNLLDEQQNLNRAKLEAALGRPFGFPIQWRFHQKNKIGLMFLESKVQNPVLDDLHSYLDQIVDLIVLMIERSYLQQQVKLLMDKWHLFADSYAQPLHVVDEQFNLVQSNYLPSESAQDTSQKFKCYEILASRQSPCETCPVLKLKNSDSSGVKAAAIKQNFDYIYTLNKKYKVNTVSFNSDQKYYFVFYEDQSEVDQLKSQVIMNEKMSVIGQLANHLAHELNNPLTGLKLMTEFLMAQEHVKSSTVKNDLNEILKGIVRCQNIIADLLQFSSDNKSLMTTVYIEEVIKKTIPLLKTITRNHNIFIDVKNVPVQLSLNQAQQVIFNLIKNACQAMGEKGSIKIYDQIFTNHYDVYFEDAGPGVDEALTEQMFQAFSTTKKDSEGTGLGLFISKKIMNKMGADLIYDNTYKSGARFILRFNRLV